MTPPATMWGSYSSRSSIVHWCRSRSSIAAKRCTFCFTRSPYGMGWRTETTRRPFARRRLATRRVVWLLPAPVRTAHTETTGTFAFSMLAFGPISRKSAPQASTSEALCITVSCETSL